MKEVLVIGDNCTDIFVYGKVNRLCPDVPAPVFSPTKTITDNGMAGNVVRNFKSLGLDADFMFNVTEMTKIRYVDEQTNHTFLRVDEGDMAEPFGSSPEVINFNFEPGEWNAIVILTFLLIQKKF